MDQYVGRRLRQARELRRWTQTELARRLGVTQPTIARLENDSLQPSDLLAKSTALHTGFPLGFFRKPLRLYLPEGSLILYRKKATMSRGFEIYLHQLAQLAMEMVESAAQRFKLPPLALPVLNGEGPISAARLTRSALGLDASSPVSNLVTRLERHGLICIALPCNGNEEFDAFSVWANNRPMIFMNPNRPTDRIRFTVGHELDHLVRRSQRGDVKTIEKEAYRFAQEFLLPEAAMREEITSPVTLSCLAELKPRWGVSVAALVRRARDLGIIEDHQYKYLNIKLRKRWGVNEPGSHLLKPERPRLLRKLVELVYGDDWRRFADEAGLPPHLVEAVLEAHAAAGQMPKKESGAGGDVIPFERRA